jgi:hypothetical protein
VSFRFGDGTIAAVTFSAKGHTFEGVREIFGAHKGNTLISLKDFKDLVIETVEKKTRPLQIFRDHGHEQNITRSFIRALDHSLLGESIEYVWETAQLFLGVQEALKTNTPLSLHPFDPAVLSA